MSSIVGYDAAAASADGSVVVGFVSDAGIFHAFRWTASGGSIRLAMPAGIREAEAGAVSADGAVIGGYATTTGAPAYRAWIWTALLGMTDLNTYLPTAGSRWTDGP